MHWPHRNQELAEEAVAHRNLQGLSPMRVVEPHQSHHLLAAEAPCQSCGPRRQESHLICFQCPSQLGSYA